MRTTVAAALLALLAVLTACTTPEEPVLPSLAEVAAARSASAPPPAGVPGPPVTAACPLLSVEEVGQVLGRPVDAYEQRAESPYGPDSRVMICGYGPLTVSVEIVPATAFSPQQIVDRAIGGYQGTLERPADLGDAALYHQDPDSGYGSLVTARAAGPEVRSVQVFLAGAADPRPALFGLARLLLDRV